MTHEMRAYGNGNGNSGITGFEIGEYGDGNGWMEIAYSNGGTYRYNEGNVGEVNFAVMKALALNGRGLNAYINKNVRGRGIKRLTEPRFTRTFTVTTTCPKSVEILSEVLTEMGVDFSVS